MHCFLFLYGLIIDLVLADMAQAARIPLRGEYNSYKKLRRRSTLQARGTSALVDSMDVSYFTNITLGGETFEVLVDTGR